MKRVSGGLVLLGLAMACGERPAPAAEAAIAASASDSARQVVLENGLVSLTIAKPGGFIQSIKYKKGDAFIELGGTREAMYLDVNAGVETAPAGAGTPPKAGLTHPLTGGEFRIVLAGPEVAELAVTAKPSTWFPFQTEAHFVLPAGESGFYAYAIFRHGKGDPAADIGQARFVIKGVPGAKVFTHHVVDDARQGAFPTANVVETLQDATYRLADGTVYTKYDNSAFLDGPRVHGMAGHGVGMWMIFPSVEFTGGGPVKQELTVHMDNVLLAMFVGGHFGSRGLNFRADEPWSKIYGPVFVYMNHDTATGALWADAKERLAAEVKKWPYPWLQNADYPLSRGVVEGGMRLTDGTSAKGAWVILGPVGEDWTNCSKGYQFWARADAEGRFSIAGVRGGKYTLHVSGANQFEDFHKEGVEVQAGATVSLGELAYKPLTHGKTLWQIGTADRSSGEFKGGDNYRHYGNFLRYPAEFPQDVTFIVGKSRQREDWNFAQWSWYNKKPVWTIQFDLAQPLAGKATLTLGFASAQPAGGATTNLKVAVNGQEVAAVHLKKSGAAGYRSGNQDSMYQVEYVRFDAALLKQGTNEITLGHAEAIPFPPPEKRRTARLAEVMYDALRLEVE